MNQKILSMLRPISADDMSSMPNMILLNSKFFVSLLGNLIINKAIIPYEHLFRMNVTLCGTPVET